MPSTLTRETFRIRGAYQGEVREFPEAASQSFVYGDFCYVTASGTLQVFLAAGNTGDTTTTGGTNLVIALGPASGTTGNMVSVLIPSQECEFLLAYVTSTSQIDSVQTAIGDELGLRYVTALSPAGITTNMWAADAGSTSNNILKLVEFDLTYESVGISGSYQPVWCKMLDAARFGR